MEKYYYYSKNLGDIISMGGKNIFNLEQSRTKIYYMGINGGPIECIDTFDKKSVDIKKYGKLICDNSLTKRTIKNPYYVYEMYIDGKLYSNLRANKFMWKEKHHALDSLIKSLSWSENIDSSTTSRMVKSWIESGKITFIKY